MLGYAADLMEDCYDFGWQAAKGEKEENNVNWVKKLISWTALGGFMQRETKATKVQQPVEQNQNKKVLYVLFTKWVLVAKNNKY